MIETEPRRTGAALAWFVAGNVLFATGLIFHAFLYNFYLDALGHPAEVWGHAAAALTAGGLAVLLPAGALADRIGARAALLAAGLVLGLGLALGAVAAAPLAIYGAAALSGAASGLWRVATAPVLMGLTTAENRSRAFAWNVALLVAWGGAGTALAGGASGWIEHAGVAHLGALRIALFAGAALSALSVLVFATASRHAAVSVRPSAGPPVRPAAPWHILPLVALVAAWMLAAALAAPFFNVYFARTFGRSIPWVGAAMGTVSVAWALAVVASGEAARRAGVRRVLIAALLCFAPAMLGLGLARSVGLAFALYLLQGLVGPITNPLIDQWLLGLVPEDRRGTVSSWRQAAADLSAMAGASLGGVVLQHAGFGRVFLLAALAGLAGGAALALGVRRSGANAA